ncbi:MAG: hypothetical protein FJ304_15105 [Planctomycetes bacterium]|nr:hypothetical protein [Planctomycetota bacterium]
MGTLVEMKLEQSGTTFAFVDRASREVFLPLAFDRAATEFAAVSAAQCGRSLGALPAVLASGGKLFFSAKFMREYAPHVRADLDRVTDWALQCFDAAAGELQKLLC